MSVIALAGVPNRVNIDHVIKHLKSSIRDHLEFMNFIPDRHDRTAFLRLSEKLDPLEVVEMINSKKRGSLRAYIPEEVPDFPYRTKRKASGKISVHMRLASALDVLVQEMQSKFAGLHDLSAGTSHRLLHDIAKTIYKRLCKILDQMEEGASVDSRLRLTKWYRKRYPHFGDFQLILSTLHSIQDADGEPREQMQESDLTSYTIQSYVVDNIPFDKVQHAYNKYLDKITSTITNHVENMEMTPRNTSPEELARIKIREHFKTLLPYLPLCIKHVTAKYFIPQESSFYRVHVYGEPALPNREALAPFLKRHRVMSTKLSIFIYNMLVLEVPRDQFTALLAADGTLVGGCKLVIRPTNLPRYRVPRAIIKQFRSQVTTKIFG